MTWTRMMLARCLPLLCRKRRSRTGTEQKGPGRELSRAAVDVLMKLGCTWYAHGKRKTEPDRGGLDDGERDEASIGTWLPRVPARSPFCSLLPFPARISELGEGERRQRCEGHLPLPPSRTLTKGGHGRTWFMPDGEHCYEEEGDWDKKDARRRVLRVFHTPSEAATCESSRTKKYLVSVTS